MHSVRWKLLLQFSCRNRLLLTGTPIQNSMAEVRGHFGIVSIITLYLVYQPCHLVLTRWLLSEVIPGGLWGSMGQLHLHREASNCVWLFKPYISFDFDVVGFASSHHAKPVFPLMISCFFFFFFFFFCISYGRCFISSCRHCLTAMMNLMSGSPKDIESHAEKQSGINEGKWTLRRSQSA